MQQDITVEYINGNKVITHPSGIVSSYSIDDIRLLINSLNESKFMIECDIMESLRDIEEMERSLQK